MKRDCVKKAVGGPNQDILKLFRNYLVNPDKIHKWHKELPGAKHQGHSSYRSKTRLLDEAAAFETDVSQHSQVQNGAIYVNILTKWETMSLKGGGGCSGLLSELPPW